MNQPEKTGIERLAVGPVRQSWGDPMLFAFPDAFPDRWTVVNVDCGHHSTEAAALVAALEAAQ